MNIALYNAPHSLLALSPGTRLSAYDIVAALGAGGMGEVYRAHDRTLDRQVAIKVLPELFAADADRLARFEREARVLASLNHPNIATIHGLERSGATAFLIMELAAGETLASRIARGRLPIDELVHIATQIAAALEAAHEKGVVHRDLKPANVVVSADGKVKVLDFGLAKAMSQDVPAIDVSLSPTMAHAGTMAGTVIGTAAYMSPEQARGKAVDKRADIWAFGCVLFEMATGRQAFAGETLTDVLAAVVQNDPDWTALPAGLPSGLRSTIRRCLRKNPVERLHDIADARIELSESASEPGAATAQGRNPSRRPALVPWMLAIAATAIAFVLGVRSLPRASSDSAPPTARLELNAPPGVELFNGAAQSIALSPDGRRIAFIGTLGGARRVYVRRLDQFEAVPQSGTESAFSCFFSPDGQSIGFISTNRSLKKLTLSDGRVLTLTPSDADYTTGSAWGQDDRITFGRGQTLWQVAASGGTPAQLTRLENGELTHAFPSNAGQGLVLFTTITSTRKPRIEALATASGRRHVVVDSASFGMTTPDGHLVFFSDGALLAARFDRETATLTGPPVRVFENLGIGNAGAPLVALSESGSLLYANSDTAASTLVWVSRQGAEQQVTEARRLYFGPRVSPDGRRIVVQAGGDLWIHDSTRATFTRLTSDSTFGNSFPIWTPDGARIIFRTSTGLFSVDADGGSPPRLIAGTSVGDFPTSVSPDGDSMLVARQMVETSQDVYVISLRGRFESRPFVKTPAFEGGAEYSPDGRWVAYVSDESGQMQVYIRPSEGADRRWQVSTDGGTAPVWNRNGREIFYRSANKLMTVSVAGAAELALSAPHLVFDQNYAFGQTITIANYDVSPDGQRFLMLRNDPGSGRLNIVLNWFEELKHLSPTK